MQTDLSQHYADAGYTDGKAGRRLKSEGEFAFENRGHESCYPDYLVGHEEGRTDLILERNREVLDSPTTFPALGTPYTVAIRQTNEEDPLGGKNAQVWILDDTEPDHERLALVATFPHSQAVAWGARIATELMESSDYQALVEGWLIRQAAIEEPEDLAGAAAYPECAGASAGYTHDDESEASDE